MKRYLFAFLCMMTALGGFAQEKDTSLLYVKYPTIPLFKLYKAPDSTVFTKADLKKKKPVMIMIFSPDCEHCQHQTNDILNLKEEFENIQVVMASPIGYSYVKAFYEKFDLGKVPNFTVANDPGYLLGNFYKIHRYPSMFLYNKKGKFITSFEGNVAVNKILEAFKK